MIDRTPHAIPDGDDPATLQHIADALGGENDARSALVDRSETEPQLAVGSTVSGNRGLRWILTASTAVRIIWDNAATAFKLLNEAGALQKIAIANGTDATHAVTKSQLDSGISQLSDDLEAEAQARQTADEELVANQVFTLKEKLPDQAIAPGTTVSVAHALGVRPTSFETFLKCVTPEYGYLAGEEIPVSPSFLYYTSNDNDRGSGQSISADESTVKITFTVQSVGTYVLASRQTGSIGVNVSITNANWKLIVWIKA
jgi:hypothetical protein